MAIRVRPKEVLHRPLNLSHQQADAMLSYRCRVGRIDAVELDPTAPIEMELLESKVFL
jgi:hypothetical protein